MTAEIKCEADTNAAPWPIIPKMRWLVVTSGLLAASEGH